MDNTINQFIYFIFAVFYSLFQLFGFFGQSGGLQVFVELQKLVKESS